MVPVARDEGINGDDIEACSDHHAFAKLFPTSEAREVRACYDAMQRYFFSASQPRVSTSVSLPACLVVRLFGTVSQLFFGWLCMSSVASACVIVCAYQCTVCIWRRPVRTFVCKCHFRLCLGYCLLNRPLFPCHPSLLCVPL